MYDNFEEINQKLDHIEKMQEKINQNFENIKEETLKDKILSTCNYLNTKIITTKRKLNTDSDINVIDYVIILGLIKEIITYYANDKMNIKLPASFYGYYDLVLTEIESALDDLTIESLMLVIKQYQNIEKLRSRSTKSSEYPKIRKEIDESHDEFQKVISKH